MRASETPQKYFFIDEDSAENEAYTTSKVARQSKQKINVAVLEQSLSPARSWNAKKFAYAEKTPSKSAGGSPERKISPIKSQPVLYLDLAKMGTED